ncbi:MAG TPA: hypothetical protein VFK59_05855 [Actinomycetota bacterium]|nr:hypothetical protein [Actinomycetota bacterium]
MEDFNALASSLAAGVVDVRGCLILSRDGLVLGAYPSEAETQTKPAWLRFATMGDPERGFAQFGSETWCYVRRGPYAAFAVTGPAARPGLVIDHIEQALLAAERSRGKLEDIRGELLTQPVAPTAKPRTPLHAERPLEEPVVITAEASPVTVRGTHDFAPSAGGKPGSIDDPSPVEGIVGLDGAELPLAAPQESSGLPRVEEEAPSEPPEVAPAAEATDPEGAPSPGPGGVWGTSDEGEEIDRFSLSREFGQLLQDEGQGADGYATRDRRM